MHYKIDARDWSTLTLGQCVGITKAISCACSFAWMAGKEELSAVVVKGFKCFFQRFSVPDGEPERSCGGLELEGHQCGAESDF